MVRLDRLPSADLCWQDLVNYEKDSHREPALRCLAAVCTRRQLLEGLCAEIRVNPAVIAALTWCVLHDIPTPDASPQELRDFAQFRNLVADRVLAVWSEKHANQSKTTGGK